MPSLAVIAVFLQRSECPKLIISAFNPNVGFWRNRPVLAGCLHLTPSRKFTHSSTYLGADIPGISTENHRMTAMNRTVWLNAAVIVQRCIESRRLSCFD
jgi:hypothetical protein